MRVHNFGPGPAIIPEPVLEQAASALRGVPELGGLPIAEVSHRLPTFERIVAEARDRLRALMGIPESHVILFLQGGARAQFAQIPLNWLGPGKVAGYVDTGVWSTAAYEDARLVGDARLLASGKSQGYVRLPDPAAIEVPPGLAYVHTTSNNTIYGTQWPALPDLGPAPHVCDISSDVLSRRFDVARFACLYAGTQKNAGIAGLTLVVLERSFMEAARADIPTIWQYRVQEANDSMYNTPPTFAIYVTLLVLRWLEEQGGVPALEARNEAKAQALYAAIDGSGGFYRANVQETSHRSRMNVTWRLPSEDLERRFIAEAEAAGLHHLKGHRKAGGLRASLYNALGMDAVQALVDFMGAFRERA